MSQASEYREAELAAFDAMPVREGCLFCEWEYSGTALQGREKALEHRREVHPKAGLKRIKRPKNRNLVRYHNPELSREQKAEIQVDRERRARLNGVALY